MFELNGRIYNVDLTTLKDKELPEDVDYSKGNEFHFTLLASKDEITFKLLSHSDELAIERELKGLKKINPNASPELSTRLKYIITSVNNDRENKTIREFVENQLLARDSRALRQEVKRVSPDINLTIQGDNGEDIMIPINLNFFWPDLDA